MLIARADAARLPLADRSVDLVIGSPPYLDARTYGIGAQRGLDAWVAWMLDVTREALRVTRGLVVWVCAGVTRQWCYQPGPEALLADGVRSGLIAWRPVYWRRVGIPGSGGKQWYRADVEYCLAFARERGAIPWAEPTANGKPPKWAPGGEMSHRMTSGRRVATLHTKANRNGEMVQQGYIPPNIANPGNLLSTTVGGGQLGHDLAHENEAPYPVDVPRFFIRSHCPPGGLVLDPFSGSGTTVDAAAHEGRIGIGFDLRQSQCILTRRRMTEDEPLFQAVRCVTRQGDEAPC